ncbi:MAG: hypothetical protein B7Y25_07300, partial [Alphaproteobacteria bacterium 16-39-46]
RFSTKNHYFFIRGGGIAIHYRLITRRYGEDTKNFSYFFSFFNYSPKNLLSLLDSKALSRFNDKT